MPSPSKKRLAAPVDERQRITNFFKRAPPNPTPSPSAPEAQSTAGARQHSPIRSPTSRVTGLASATPEPCSPRKDFHHASPRVVPILTNQDPRHNEAQPSTTRPPAIVAPPNISFTSTSSRQSVPCSSSGSSRRIVKDGLMAVPNSDSDSLSDDSDDLPDIQTFMPTKKRRIEHSGASDNTVSNVGPASSTSRFGASLAPPSTVHRNWSQRPAPMAPPKPKQNYKHSLANLVKERKAAEEAQARIAEVEASIERADKLLEETDGQEANISNEKLLTMFGDDDENGERVKQAILHTEALEGFEPFVFFSSTQPCAAQLAFPAENLPNEVWADFLRDEDSRTQACLAGFVAELGKSGRIPAEVTRWFAVELVRETRAELCNAYVTIIQTCAHHKHALHGSLSALGTYYPCGEAKEAQLQSDSQLLGPPSQDDPEPDLPPFAGLSYVVRVIQSCAPNAGTDITSRAIADLVLAGLDDRIAPDMALRIQLDDAVEDLLLTLPQQEMDQVTDYLRERFFDDEGLSPLIKCRIVLSFPATSTPALRMRRHLALFCITHEKESRALDSPNWPKALLSRLYKAPEFIVRDAETDYTLLTHLAAVLDVAVDAGFSADFPWLDRQKSAQTIGLFNRPAEQTSAEKAFNTRIDEFTARIRAIMSRIKESGVVHLKRHEARAALENVHVRLQQSVRTRPPPRKGILDADPNEAVLPQTAMQRFAPKLPRGDGHAAP